ncbi:acetate--CoA ligase family protein [Roseiarcaceae bacterium H3SJ34-1]|uniref:acetate--CoA ligase family protein n=1 Tax=Terripilifer ovatus TaxID=3032367 RepID=UPI003AB96B39|nr:acetate--CoA ligase family protein [Roseiarcaceae bacterium H3SJ34-1]
MADILDRFFYARTLAIVGASSDPAKLGGRSIRHNQQLRYSGRLLPVNPSVPMVQGLPAIASIEDLPDDVDCAVVALPAAGVEKAIEDLAKKGVPLAVILSSGFAEHSPAGAAVQARLVSRAREAGMRLVGPNSMGGMSFVNAMSATFTSISEHEGRDFPALGAVSIASQSGFIGSHLMGVLRDRGLGIAKWLATGNQADVDLSDCIAHYARDEVTRVIVVYLEGAGRADALRAAFDLARERGKPVVALKAGRSDLGARAIASHTAALVGDADVYDAVFRRHGVIGVASLDELADVVAALDTGRLIDGRRLGVATVSGGFGILISDVAAQHGFELPELAPDLQTRINEAYSLATTRNPVDMGSLVRFDTAVAALQDHGYDALVFAAGHFGLVTRLAEQLYAYVATARDREPERFIAVVACLSEAWCRKFQQLGVFVCEDPARAVRALAAVSFWNKAAPDYAASDIPDTGFLPIEGSVALESRNERGARDLLRAIGVPVVEDILAKSGAEAAVAARRIGGRVVLKIVSSDIAHKSDIGGVRLNVDPSEAEAVFDDMFQAVRERAPGAHLDGVIVSPMISGGIETIVGVKRDAVFGPVVMFGLGGVFVEVFHDTAVEIAPFGRTTAHALIHAIKGYPLLLGVRGSPPADLEALADVLCRISVFAATHAEQFESLEINPLLVRPDGVLALDALVAGPNAVARSMSADATS